VIVHFTRRAIGQARSCAVDNVLDGTDLLKEPESLGIGEQALPLLLIRCQFFGVHAPIETANRPALSHVKT